MRTIRLIFSLVLGISLLAGCQRYWASPPAGQGLPTAEAYPPPVWTEEPTEPPLPTMTPLPTVPTTPTPTYPPGPPKPTPEVTPILPFPTPAFPPIPQGERPAALGTIWYPYLPSPDARPVLRGVLVDEKGRRWGESERIFEFPPGWGSAWGALHPSPDGRTFVADIISGEESRSFWLDPASGELKPISTDPQHEDFLAWGPDHQVFAWNGLGISGQEIWLVDLQTQERRGVFAFPKAEYSFIGDLATSPDGTLLADACYTYGVSGVYAEVGLQPLEKKWRERVVIAAWDIPGRALVCIGGLDWSPNGQSLALNFAKEILGDSVGEDVQLWLIQKDGSAPILLAHKAYGPMWSPDGRYIAFIRREAYEGPAPADLWLLDVATSTEIRLTQFDDRRYVTSVAWSPDGQRLAFAITVEIGDSIEGYDKIGDYGEIWITSLDGKEQYPVAGPTAPDASVAWLPAAKGGQK